MTFQLLKPKTLESFFTRWFKAQTLLGGLELTWTGMAVGHRVDERLNKATRK